MSDVILTPPLSKSDAQRALILARILGAPDPLPKEDLPSDVQVLRTGLDVLAAGGSEIQCRDGGAPFRFLLTQAAVTPGAHVKLSGTARLAERPHAALFEALQPAAVRGSGTLLAEVRAFDPLPESFTVSSDQSSQFASSLLLGAASISHRTQRACSVRVEGARVSDGYLQMTVRWLRAAGFDVRGDSELVVKWVGEQPLPEIPGDWSSIGYLLLVAWSCDARVARLSDPALHPDGAIVAALSSVGLTVRDDGRVIGALHGYLDVSARRFPDSIPTLAALACLLPEPSRFTDCGILRGKESDRVQGITALAEAAGATVQLDDDTLVLTPPKQVRPLKLDSRDDHRIAMAAGALAAMAHVPLRLRGIDCVKKSFPGFWRELAFAGASVHAQ
jgi:3-phosphoshikimate 1-carboxyvinyltransferase